MTAAGRPTVVTLCGSTRFKQAFIDANFRETMAGNIVLSVGWFAHADGAVYTPTAAEKQGLDRLHLRKIDLSDEILVLNVDGYVGDSTSREIAYAWQTNKRVRWFLDPWPGHQREEAARHWQRWASDPLLNEVRA